MPYGTLSIESATTAELDSVDTFLDGWYVLLYVPSAVVPGGHSQEWNLLVNPRHPDSGSVVGGKSSALFIDSRLKT